MAGFHSGEVQVQLQRGVREDALRLEGMAGPQIPAPAGPFLARQSLAIAATLDGQGRPWASLLEGPPGFLEVVDPGLLRIAAAPASDDPLHANLAGRDELGLLVLDPRTRRRLRLNGRGVARPEGLFLAPNEVYGNCPKYIQVRRLHVGADASSADRVGPSPVRVTTALDPAQAAFVAAADTLFIASFHPERGADASHRGGRPGFVRVPDPRTLEWDDYPGNNMFNTLGNLSGHPWAGLLFVDFERGDLLQITGRARILDGPPGVRVETAEVRETRGGGRLRWALVERWPALP